MYKRKMKLSPIHISLIALAILVVIAVIVTFAVKRTSRRSLLRRAALSMTILPLKAVGRRSRRRKSSSASTTRCRRA